MINFEYLREVLIDNDSFLITSHVNPDADAIGSEMALYEILIEIGKHVRIVNYSETPYYLHFLDPKGIIETFDAEKHAELFSIVDVIAALDFNMVDRVVKMADLFKVSPAFKICIDHHQDPEVSAFDHLFLDTDYCATGHIIYDINKHTSLVEWTYEIALPLYAAIMTDTGGFRFDRTTPEVHRVAAHFLELGVKPHKVYDQIYDQSKFGKTKLLGEAISSLKLFGEGKELAVMILTQEMLSRTGALETDTEGFVNLALSVEKVRVALLFMELKDGFKVNFRSKGELPVHRLAREYGGGGHMNAAGLRLRNTPMTLYKQVIINRALEYLKQYPEEE